MDDYLDINRKTWDAKAALHRDSEFYNSEKVIQGESSLNDIELALLGDVKGKSILHLQCHFGLDSLSLSRLGAKVTGVDFSEIAIEEAFRLAKRIGLDTKFIREDIYSLPEKLDQKFDIVFSSYGTIGWLPSIERWAEVVKNFLKPGGFCLLVEFHPFIWMFNNELTEITYRYFNDAPIIEDSELTYTGQNHKVAMREIGWNHGLGEVHTALRNQGLNITLLSEYDYSPYPIFPDMIESSPGHFNLNKWGNKVPLVYALKAAMP